tara:strand:+ start:457 stop:3039 length:2583 start_codon:yes stop_codon:yes gene_type:complete
MLRITYISIASITTLLVGMFIFISIVGIKTDIFNNLINEKINELNSKVKLDLNEVNFKLNSSNFEFEVVTLDTKILINEKKIDLEFIKFDLNILDYFNNENPISKISIVSKENDIDKITDFINEYDFNLARNFILKQIKKGKIKISSIVTFYENEPEKFKYTINGSITDAEFKLLNKLEFNNINFEFFINQDLINFREVELSFDEIFITSDDININKIKNQFEINGNLKTKKTKINLKNYKKLINTKIDFIDDQIINLSSDNNLSFKINNKLKINDLNIQSKLNFDDLYINPKYQDLIYLKNGNFLIDYAKDKFNINLESNFLFKNEKYNNYKSDNLIKASFKKKQNTNANVDIYLSNTKNKINSKELKKIVLLENFSLLDQDITLTSENNIKFNLDKSNKIKNLNIKSKLITDKISIDYKSQRIKKYFSNFKNQFELLQSKFDINYNDNRLKLILKSKYSINDIDEHLNLDLEKNEKNYSFDLDMDLDSVEIKVNELEYVKNSGIKSNLYINGTYKDTKEITFNNIQFNEEQNKLLVKNLEIGKNDKIKNLDLFKINLVTKTGKKNDLEFKKVNNNYYLTGSKFDGTKNIKNLLDNSSKSIFSYFKNLNTSIYLDIGKYFINDFSYLSNLKGEILLKNNNVFKSNINAKLNNKSNFKLTILTDSNKQKITNLEIQRPEPFIENFKFIKGFKEGNLLYESSQYEGKTISNLKIMDFKVQEVPVLAKLLTLASLQGIADLLTGEGIRFTDFEMDYETLGNTTNIKELYAIGPAISIIMEGYIVKDNLTSLKGTLVPATTVNKTISKIPMLGEILVGKKVGEGVFGVSFKIKGPPNKLKTTVNPIKTLTPRFITRTLEKISN